MVAKPEMLGHFIFNSDYPVDKIVWLYEGSFTASSGNSTTPMYIDMQKELGSKLTIFIKGACTVDNWATSIMIGSVYSRPGENAELDMAWTNYNINTGTSGAFLQLTPHFQSHGGKTVKYRLWGVVRDDIHQAVDYNKNTRATKTKLVFNTDLNYPRLYMDGVAKSGETITHNLGKIPYMDYWYITKYPTTITGEQLSNYWSYRPSGGFGSAYTSPCIRATDSTVTFRQTVVNGNETRDVYYYYRLYA